MTLACPLALYESADPKWNEKKFGECKTLDEIRRFWNSISLVEGFLVLDKLDSISLRTPDFPKVDVVVSAREISGQTNELFPDKRPKLTSDGWEAPSVELEYNLSSMLDGIKDDVLESFSVPNGGIRFDRASIKSLQLHTRWSANPKPCAPAIALDAQLGKKRDFAEAFPNLEKLPDDYQNKRLASLNTVLDEATEKSKEQIEVFDAKISSELIPLFGLPILAIFLFQFSAVAFYVKSNAERIEVEEASEWSFLLRGLPFLILGAGTILVLPAAAAILSFIQVPGETILPRPINFLLALLVVLLSGVALWRLLILRSRVSLNPTVWRKTTDLESK